MFWLYTGVTMWNVFLTAGQGEHLSLMNPSPSWLPFPRILWLGSLWRPIPMTTPQVYDFPKAAVTNYYKCGGLKQHKFILLQFWRSWLMSVIRVTFLLEASGQSVFSPFSVSRGCLCSLACGLFLVSLQPLASVITSSTTHSDPPASLLEDSADDTESTISSSQNP